MDVESQGTLNEAADHATADLQGVLNGLVEKLQGIVDSLDGWTVTITLHKPK